MMTLPTTTKGTALVNVGKGVKINRLHYWSSVLRDPAVERTSVPVRYDPYDAGTACTRRICQLSVFTLSAHGQ